MKLQNIQYLLEIEKTGSINKASKNLFISQPRLSSIIKDMEDEMGMPFFVRSKNGVVATPQGHDFLLQAKSILTDLENLKRNYSTGAGEDDISGFKLSTTRSSHIMEIFVSFCAEYKSDNALRFYINEGNTDDVIEDVAENGYNLGVIFFNAAQKNTVMSTLASKGLEYTHLLSAKPHILMAKNHPLLASSSEENQHSENRSNYTKIPQIHLKSLLNYGFVRYIDPYENFMHFLVSEDTLVDLNKSKKIIYVYGRSSMLHMISKSDFFGIGIRGFKSQESLYGVVSAPIANSNVEIEFGYVYPKGRELSKLSDAFISRLKKEFYQN